MEGFLRDEEESLLGGAFKRWLEGVLDADFLKRLDGIEQKMQYRIGEVSKIVGVASHVLRYWEKEFSGVEAEKSPSSNHRFYSLKQVKRLCLVQHLMHKHGFSVATARQVLQSLERAKKHTDFYEDTDNLWRQRVYEKALELVKQIDEIQARIL